MPELLQIHSGAIPVVHQRERPTGFLEGTLIRTAEGDRPVEYLLAGDRIETRDNGTCELRGTSTLVACDIDVVAFLPNTESDADTEAEPLLVVPAMQQVAVDDWRAKVVYEQSSLATPAGSLVDGVRVMREKRKLVRLFRLHFDSPQMVASNGFYLSSEKTRAPQPFSGFDEELIDEEATPPRNRMH
ncbi:MAG: Hint domain-containing protein [Pararhodobacter sp.]|nr:Hint domain-containing protein [Pararhodobacter sp.]